MAFVFLLAPFSDDSLVGVPAGVYRFSSSAHKLSPVVIPGVTRAPVGGLCRDARRIHRRRLGGPRRGRARGSLRDVPPARERRARVPGHRPAGRFRPRVRRERVSHHLLPVFGTNNRGDVAFQGHVAGEEILPRKAGFSLPRSSSPVLVASTSRTAPPVRSGPSRAQVTKPPAEACFGMLPARS